MGFKDTFSPRIASLASQGLFDPTSLSLDDVRAICATALARVPDHRQSDIVKARPLVEQIDMALAVVSAWPVFPTRPSSGERRPKFQ